jgi:hypothetical protein
MAELRRLWINSPAAGAAFHYLHGTNVLGYREEDKTGSLYRVYPLSGTVTSFQMSGLHLSDGWIEAKDQKAIAASKEKRDAPIYRGNSFYLVYRTDGSNPAVKHQSRGEAEAEAIRLAKKHPGKEFFVVHAILSYQSEILEPRQTRLI